MEEKERQDVIEKFAKEEWKKTLEDILVLKVNNAGEVFEQLELLKSVGYNESKVVVVFPEGYTVDDLAANKPEPEGAKWYILAHKTYSR